jgi:hypothetical protein
MESVSVPLKLQKARVKFQIISVGMTRFFNEYQLSLSWAPTISIDGVTEMIESRRSLSEHKSCLQQCAECILTENVHEIVIVELIVDSFHCHTLGQYADAQSNVPLPCQAQSARGIQFELTCGWCKQRFAH